jgi:hypothetical protein
VRTFLKSETMVYLGLIATTAFEIKFMNDLYHARWHQWIHAHDDYFLDLLKRYQQIRTQPKDDPERLQFEEEILLSIQEGNCLSGLNRAALWSGITRTAVNKVTLVCIAPILAYAFWSHKKDIGQISWAVVQQAASLIPTGLRMLPIAARFGAAGAVYAWQNKKEVAQALIEIPVGAATGLCQIGFEAAQMAAIAIGGAVIITGATIAQNKTVRAYGLAAIEYGRAAMDVAHAGIDIGKDLIRRYHF